jgi:hypothetical protein
MISALTQVRVAAAVYALLGLLATAAAVVLIRSTWPLMSAALTPREFVRGAGIATSVSIGVAIAFWVMAALSLRYLALTQLSRSLTFWASFLITLYGTLEGIQVTFGPGSDAPGWTRQSSQIVLAWVVALSFGVCSCLLWKQRRASNNRWRGP